MSPSEYFDVDPPATPVDLPVTPADSPSKTPRGSPFPVHQWSGGSEDRFFDDVFQGQDGIEVGARSIASHAHTNSHIHVDSALSYAYGSVQGEGRRSAGGGWGKF